MVPESGTNGATGVDAFGRRQALFVRRMMLLSMLFHGGVMLLGSAASSFFPIAAPIPPVVPVELTDAPMSPPLDLPPPPEAAVLLARQDAPVAARPAAARKQPASSDARRWLAKLDAGLAAVPPSQAARVTAGPGGIPVRRWGNEAVARPDAFPPSGSPGSHVSSDGLLQDRESRLRASGRRGAGVGIESEAAVMFRGAGTTGGDGLPPWLREMIRRKVRDRLPELEAVYSEALRRNPELKGRILVRLRIGATGTVERAESEETSMPDASFTEHILEKVRRWTFEPTDGRTVEVLYPLVFFVPS